MQLNIFKGFLSIYDLASNAKHQTNLFIVPFHSA